MKPFYRILFFLALLSGGVTPAWAALWGDYLIDSREVRQDIARQETVYRILKSEVDTGILRQKGELTRAWFLAKKAEGAGNTEEARESYRLLHETQHDLGYRNLESVSMALIRESYESLTGGRKDQADHAQLE